jgi:hypothetical protein
MNLGEVIIEHVIWMLEIPDTATEGRPSESPTDKKCGVATRGRFTTTHGSRYGFLRKAERAHLIQLPYVVNEVQNECDSCQVSSSTVWIQNIYNILDSGSISVFR